jgi:hypothetical protein
MQIFPSLAPDILISGSVKINELGLKTFGILFSGIWHGSHAAFLIFQHLSPQHKSMLLAENQLDGAISLDRGIGTRFTIKFRRKEIKQTG